MTPQTGACPVCTDSTVFLIMTGIRAAIPRKIKSEAPLPTPRSVISSPIHMMKTAHDVRIIVVLIRNSGPGVITTPGMRDNNWANMNDWKIAKNTVATRDIWASCRRPCSPCSFCRFSSLGITTVINCMTIDDVMKGPIPIEKTESLFKAPPVNKSIMPSKFWASSGCLVKAPGSTPGIGTCTPKR